MRDRTVDGHVGMKEDPLMICGKGVVAYALMSGTAEGEAGLLVERRAVVASQP